ncbi:restriction endonuclease subunit S [Cytobacillus sp.]|uniref:restriction endonuclease subunit S n=1 Tax=Cytobacillus sp. TaxID=2675269 RepID=UPI0028BE6458|nr:restriction endonuclease subunit S [Cytobacillus sp.]
MTSNLKPYDNYKKSDIPFLAEVPKDWEVYPFYSLANIKSKINNVDEELLSVYLNKGVIKYNQSTGTQVHKPSQDLSKYQLVEPGDLVLNNQQAWRGSVGVSKYRGIVSPAYYVFGLSNLVNPDFGNYLFRDSVMVNQYVLSSKGVGSIQRNLYYPFLKRVLVPLPSRIEQEQIVKYLDYQMVKIDKFIKTKKKLITVLKEQIESHLYGNVTGHTTIKSWESAFPEDWKLIKSKRLFKEIKINNCPGKELLAVTQDKGVVLKKDCDINYVSPSGDLSGLKLVRKGDFVISLRSFQGGIEFSNIEGIVSPAYNVFCLRKEYSSEEYNFYYKYLFKTKAFISMLNTIVSGIRDGKNISYTDFSKLNIPVPPIETALEVMELVKKYEYLKIQFEQEHKLLNEYSRKLISDIVTGKVDVRNIKVDGIQEINLGDEISEDEIIDLEEVLEGEECEV